MLHKTIRRPILTHRCEYWPLSKEDGNTLLISERLTMIYGPINDNDIWRTRYNNKLYTLYDETRHSPGDKNRKTEVAGTPLQKARTVSLQFTRLKPEGTRREYPTVPSTKFTFFWDVMPCRLVDMYQHFGGMCRLHFYSRKEILRHKISQVPLAHGVTYQKTVIFTFNLFVL